MMNRHVAKFAKYGVVSVVAVILYQVIHCALPGVMFETEEEREENCHWHDVPLKLWRSFVVTVAVSVLMELLEGFHIISF